MKVSMTIISGDKLKKTLEDLTNAKVELESLLAEKRARDNETLWDKIKRVSNMPVYKNGE